MERIFTYCIHCAALCGAIAYVKDDYLIKVEGDPDSLSNAGTLCPKALAARQEIYHPDRLKYPMKRTKPKGETDPGWVRIGWDEALDTIGYNILHTKPPIARKILDAPCIAACPFGLLVVNKGKLAYFPDYLTPHERETYEAHRHRLVEKCDLCYQRIITGLLPACVQTCPTQAMVFGDLEERESDLARLVFGGDAEPLEAELKVDPSVFYLKRKSPEPLQPTPGSVL